MDAYCFSLNIQTMTKTILIHQHRQMSYHIHLCNVPKMLPLCFSTQDISFPCIFILSFSVKTLLFTDIECFTMEIPSLQSPKMMLLLQVFVFFSAVLTFVPIFSFVGIISYYLDYSLVHDLPLYLLQIFNH